jgi:hypothetical protein
MGNGIKMGEIKDYWIILNDKRNSFLLFKPIWEKISEIRYVLDTP